MSKEQWIDECIRLAIANVASGGGPFAAIIVCSGAMVATAANRVTALKDPTAHAEVMAIRAACSQLATFDLSGCELYSSCEPCPMCLGAIYWARLDRFYYACNRFDAAQAGFDDAFIYDELGLDPSRRRVPGKCVRCSNGAAPFEAWRDATHRREY